MIRAGTLSLERLSILILVLALSVTAQLSAPVSHDSHISIDGNKFLSNHATRDTNTHALEELPPGPSLCPQNVELKWQAEVSSSIYATPLITDLFSDGRKDIVVSSFLHSLEVLEADTGAEAVGWPSFHKSTVHTSPLMYDIDFDGVSDILLTTYNGEVLFFKDTGDQMADKLTVPRLRVKKLWFKGLDPDPINHDHPDLGDGEDDPAGIPGKAGKHSVTSGSTARPTPGSRPPLGGATGVGAVPNATALITQLAEYRTRMQVYRDKYTNAAMTQLLSETKARNPTFYSTLIQQLQSEGLADKDGAVHLPATITPSPLVLNASPASGVPVTTSTSNSGPSGGAGTGAGTGVVPGKQPPAVVPGAGGTGSGTGSGTGAGAGGATGTGAGAVTVSGTGTVAGANGAVAAAGKVTGAGAVAQDAASTGTTGTAGVGAIPGGKADTRVAAGSGRRLLAFEDDEQGRTGRGRRLMQADSAGDAQAAGGGVEQGPAGGLSGEAAESFGLFTDAADAGRGLELDADVYADNHLAAGTQDAEDRQVHEAVGEGRQFGSEVVGEGRQFGAGGDDEGGAYDRGAADNNGGAYTAGHDDEEGDDWYGERKYEYDELGNRYHSDDQGQEREQVEVQKQEGEGLNGGSGHDALAEERADMIRSMTEALVDPEHTLDKESYDHLYTGDYEHVSAERAKAFQARNAQWEDEQFRQEVHPKEEEYVSIDPHVLATPNIADIDGDGHEELVIAVSYFFDHEYYDQPEHAHELGDVDISKYIASGVVVFDLRTRVLKWTQHLDLSTDSTIFKAYAYAAPTLADVNKDGHMEVVVGTSMGFLYVLDCFGTALPGWPVQMGEVQGQALALDINADGEVEIFAADTRGNVAAFAVSGEEVWSRHVKSLVAHGAIAGDINNDGELELVFGTSSGHIYALSGSTGADIKNFPFRTHGRVHAPVLITRLLEGPSQHLIVPSFDGYLYMIDGITGCADTVDIGETSYSMVLADDLDGNGRLDLLVSTMNGNVYAFETPALYHPLKAWTAQVMGPNGQVARHDLVGIYATKASRAARDVAGDKLQIQVAVIDKRGVFAPNGTLISTPPGPYNISAMLKGVGVHEMGAGQQPVIGVADTVAAPGVYLLEVPCPRTRTTATVHLEMTDRHGLQLSDEFTLSFHMHFHKLLKWLVAGPLLVMAASLLLGGPRRPEDEEEEEEERGRRGGRHDSLLPLTAQAGPGRSE